MPECNDCGTEDGPFIHQGHPMNMGDGNVLCRSCNDPKPSIGNYVPPDERERRNSEFQAQIEQEQRHRIVNNTVNQHTGRGVDL